MHNAGSGGDRPAPVVEKAGIAGHGFFKVGRREHEARIGHGNGARRGGRGFEGDLLIRHGNVALRHLADIHMSDELGILANDGERMRCAQLLNLAPGDGNFPGHVALENDGIALGALKLADELLAIGEYQNVRLWLGGGGRLRVKQGGRASRKQCCAYHG